MATVYVAPTDGDVAPNGDINLKDLITGRSMAHNDFIQLRSDVNLKITESPSIYITGIGIDAFSTCFIDGANALNPIHMRCTGNNLFALDPGAELSSSLGWYDIGTSNGTAGQVFDISSFWTGMAAGGETKGHLPGVWVETGRRISYKNAAGLIPEVDDWVYKTGSVRTDFGRILSVSDNGDGTGYFVVKYFTGTLITDDAIEVRKIVDNKGPDYQRTWTGQASTADVLEAGVYQEYANVYTDNADALTATVGNKYKGFAFSQQLNGTTITFGNDINGTIPPNGANIRVPMITTALINSTTFAANEMYSTTYALRLTARDGGVVNLKGVTWCDGDPFFYEVVEPDFEYCSLAGAMGNQAAIKGVLKNCIKSDRPASSLRNYGLTVWSNYTITDCLSMVGGVAGTANNSRCIRLERPENTVVKNNIVVSTSHNIYTRQIDYNSTKDILIDNNITASRCTVLSGGGSVSGAKITNHKADLSYNDTVAQLDQYLVQCSGTYETPDPVELIGWEIVGARTYKYATGVIQFYLWGGLKIRGWGLPDDPIVFDPATRTFNYTGGSSGNADIARVYITMDYGTDLYPYRAPFTAKTTYGYQHLQNISTGHYRNSFYATNSNSKVRGIEGFGGQSVGWYREVRNYWAKAQGLHAFDVYYSDTHGGVLFTSMPPSTETDGVTCITSAGTQFNAYDSVRFVNIGDTLELEMDYYTQGHQTLTGNFFTCSNLNGIGANTVDGNALSSNVDQALGQWLVEFQYDIGAGWNGSWLDLRVPTNLTSITVPDSGIKFKIKITAQVAAAIMMYVGIETTAPLAYRRQHLYPIDQVSIELKFTVLDEAGNPVQGALVYIDDNNTAPYLFQSTTAADGTASMQYTGGALTGTTWRVRKYGYKRSDAVVDIGTENINLPVTFVADPQQV